MTQAILVINAGSSSLKFALYRADDLSSMARGVIDGIGIHTEVIINEAPEAVKTAMRDVPAKGGHQELAVWMVEQLTKAFPDLELLVAGHRVVHGGREYTAPARITPEVVAQIESLTPLAPNHQPHHLAAIRAVTARWPNLLQVACFDTQFHRTQPELAQLFAVPRPLIEEGVIRYGFHGLSYEYIASVLPGIAGEKAKGRVIVAHLGNGASMCAMKDLRSQATTMGFTATDGLVMGKRCGALDPGVVLYLLEQKGMAPKDVNDLLNKKSGLLGVSGISSDIRDLYASDKPEAKQALDLFVYRAALEIGSLTAALGGLDAIVFTAGIGEHAAGIRQGICESSAWLGVKLDAEANKKNAQKISAADSKVDVYVVPTNEELMIARAASAMVQQFKANAA